MRFVFSSSLIELLKYVAKLQCCTIRRHIHTKTIADVSNTTRGLLRRSVLSLSFAGCEPIETIAIR